METCDISKDLFVEFPNFQRKFGAYTKLSPSLFFSFPFSLPSLSLVRSLPYLILKFDLIRQIQFGICIKKRARLLPVTTNTDMVFLVEEIAISRVTGEKENYYVEREVGRKREKRMGKERKKEREREREFACSKTILLPLRVVLCLWLHYFFLRISVLFLITFSQSTNFSFQVSISKFSKLQLNTILIL